MKKHFIKIFLISLALFMVNIPNVKALCGDLIYDVLDLKITSEKIIIDGWALIHLTNNNKNTNPQIKINLCKSENNCYFTEGEGIVNGSGFDFTNTLIYNNKKEYDYKSIGFQTTIELNKLADKFSEPEKQNLYFTIAATNDDYNLRYNNCKGTEIFNEMVKTNHNKEENGKKWVEEKLNVLDEVITNTNDSNFIKVTATGTKTLLFTGWHAVVKGERNPTQIGWGQIYKYNGKNKDNILKYNQNSKDTNPGEYIIKASKTTKQFFSISDQSFKYYTCANYDSNNTEIENYKYFNIKEYQTGSAGNGAPLGFCENYPCRKVINPLTSDEFPNICSGEINIESKQPITRAKVYGVTTLTIKIKSDKKCEVSKQSTDPMECNKWKDLSSECKELTVRNNNSSAVVKIEQNGYISNIFKSNLVNNDTNYNANSYDGGWFKYGITYYNEVSWNIGNLSQGNVEEIEYAMKSRLKSIQEFKDGLNLTITGLEEITGNKLIKNCSESGSFKNDNKNDNKLITVCTFFLPSSVLENFNGTVKYLEDENKANINNKYYIPLNEKEHSIKVTLENLSRLKDDKAKADSKDKIEPWTGAWNITTSCLLKVTNRLYENGKYKFIYRPINLNNPFPNRFPGVNWYTWYITEGNKDRKTLEDSYKKPEYYTELDNRTISTIKEYNKNHNYFSKVDTDFFGDYIKEGGNS